MEALKLRLLPHTLADGPANMATDEVLLTSAAAGQATFRVYGWTEATVSLGYFQSSAVRRDNPLLSSLPYVRRPTGGLMLVHHHELTYALALPPGSEWQTDPPWLQRMHRVVAFALAALGVTAALHADPKQVSSNPLCFTHHTPGDLKVGPHKVAGSAQRRFRGALLQHGAILLAQSPHTPELPGIAELTGQRLSIEDLVSALCQYFCEETGWRLEPAALLAAEMEAREYFLRTRYLHPAWNDKR